MDSASGEEATWPVWTLAGVHGGLGEVFQVSEVTGVGRPSSSDMQSSLEDKEEG